jgi:two-component system response regulator CpxR
MEGSSNQSNTYPSTDPKILLVDDEREFVQTLQERLGARGFDAAIAYNGEDALSVVDADAPDVMVLDLKMPGIDGLTVLRHVKQDNHHTAVIILTGHGSKAERNLATDLGVFSYLQKPVDIEVLTQVIREADRKIKRSSGGA